MQRNIILISVLLLFITLMWVGETFMYAGKPDQINDLEYKQEEVNERVMTAEILSQSLNRVYQVFKNNLNDRKIINTSHNTMYFLNDLTDILNKLDIKILHIKPLRTEKQKNYIISPYLLEISCSYEQLGKFISELEKDNRLIELIEFEIQNGFERITNLNQTNKLPDQLISIEMATISLNKLKS